VGTRAINMPGKTKVGRSYINYNLLI